MPVTSLSDLVSRYRLPPINANKSGAFPNVGIVSSYAYAAPATGAPAWAAFPASTATAADGVLLNRGSSGALALPPDSVIPATPAFFSSVSTFMSLQTMCVLMDRLWHYNPGTIPNGATSLANPLLIDSALRDRGLVWALETSLAFAATAINVTLTLEHEDLTTASLVLALPAPLNAGRLFGINSPDGKPIRRVTAASNSAANTGSYYITANLPGPILNLHSNRRLNAATILDPLTLGPVPWHRRNPCWVPWLHTDSTTTGGPNSMLEIGDLS